MPDALIVKDLKKTYKTRKEVVHALKGITFSVKRGEIFGLLGPNGAGKSTTINILTGLLEKDSGEVLYFGKEFSEDVQERINAASAFKALNGGLTVEQNLRVFAMMYNVKDREVRIDELLELFRITELRDRKVSELSSGQRARVSLCKALINRPDLLFLDEATAGLDPDIAGHVRKAIRNTKTTIVFTSHQMHEVEELCDRIAFINEGKVVAIGTSKELKKLIRNNRLVVKFAKQPANATKVLQRMHAEKIDASTSSFELREVDDVDTVLHELTKAGFHYSAVHTEQPTLEEVFVALSRREA